MHPTQIPKAVSKNRKTRHTTHVKPVNMLYEFNTTNRKNIRPDKTRPMDQANFFCGAETYSGTWLLTINRPRMRVGENMGLMRTRIKKSVKKAMITYLISKKSCSKKTNTNAMNITRNMMPAAALISRSFKTVVS